MNRTFRCKLSVLAAILGLIVIAESKAQSTGTSGDGKQISEAKNPDAEKLGLRADQLAAHPAGPNKPASVTGVTDDELASADKIEEAANACLDAIEANPTELRYQFELGRVLVLGALVDDGRERLNAAAEGGYGPAYYYLARLEDDPEKAGQLLQQAASTGFKPAEEMIAQLEAAQTTPETSSTPSPEGTATPPSTKSNTATTAGLPLHDSQITALPWEAVGSMFKVPIYQRQAVKDQVESIIHSGKKVLECSYGDPAPGEWETYYFWYESPPSNLRSLVQGLHTHPLRSLGFRGLIKAPSDSEAGRAWYTDDHYKSFVEIK